MTAEQQKVADQINSGSIKTYSGAVEALKTLGISTGGLADQKTYMQAKKSGDLPAAYAKCGNYTEYVQLYLALALPS